MSDSIEKNKTRTRNLAARIKVGSYWKQSWERGFRYIHFTGPVGVRGYQDDCLNGEHTAAFVPFPEAHLGTPCIESDDGMATPHKSFVGLTVSTAKWTKGTKEMFNFWCNYCRG